MVIVVSSIIFMCIVTFAAIAMFLKALVKEGVLDSSLDAHVLCVRRCEIEDMPASLAKTKQLANWKNDLRFYVDQSSTLTRLPAVQKNETIRLVVNNNRRSGKKVTFDKL